MLLIIFWHARVLYDEQCFRNLVKFCSSWIECRYFWPVRTKIQIFGQFSVLIHFPDALEIQFGDDMRANVRDLPIARSCHAVRVKDTRK
jgi:hypothetical protein